MAFYSLMFLSFAVYMCTDEYVSETEQVLYSSGEISSCADEGLPVSEAH